ncbi:DNA mismatch repair protein MLH1-like isoform X1 [Varroa destructor]|uniref:DNA mismatch repair protein S5 domain-containing protein n=1 Tax=Varroa destructor TaxID=109461 RepID=A0A7M7KF96_VARDE|nr:DNA mismatch repair protein MLH1-like isoform X1 [Varroa destructor]XP_022662625.1 DNA mismatch repair protein MLH1-like isoform X1 [Varroa destructor]XP_022662626.1 DNA mismatch repair protein MLH1-like isoform X1 [Varroa destructor]
MEVDRINPLPKDVVNRIAAGEVIQRPCNALKEMLENSIDAKSSKINVVLNSGGLRLIQIQDDGCGIAKEDLAIVCERFTTSKLNSFEDLKKISTFGFRGEALASITYIGHVKIATKTDAVPVGHECCYRDGKIIEGSGPNPVAMNRGTTITVEDLFFNVPQRRQAFRSTADEFRRCETLVSNYAVHFPSIGFTLSKSGELSYAVNTQKKSSVIENIRALHGQEIARELLPLEFTDDKISLRVKGYISKANYSSKRRTQFILFINNRLVDSGAIRNCLDTIYQRYLRKDDKPFIYLSLTMPTENVDVNVHPTKSEVGFLHQEYILEKLQGAVDKTLFDCDSSRHYLTKQPVLSFGNELGDAQESRRSEKTQEPAVDGNGKHQQPRDDKGVVRTDSSQEKLTTFFSQQVTNGTPNQESQTLLTSVLELREELAISADSELCRKLSKLTFVGVVSSKCSLVQIGTSLMMVNHMSFSKALFYQCALERFSSFPAFEFEPMPLNDLLTLALQSTESGYEIEMNCQEELVAMARKTLEARAQMLAEYFSLGILDGYIYRVPVLVNGLKPRPGQLPLFLLRLASDVNWENEKACFSGVCTVLAHFYASSCSETDLADIVFPAIRRKLKVRSKFMKKLVRLTSTEELYKVFERC